MVAQHACRDNGQFPHCGLLSPSIQICWRKRRIAGSATRQPRAAPHRTVCACTATHTEAVQHAGSQPQDLLILWDLDNLTPSMSNVACWAITLQEAALRLGGRLHGFEAFGNPATLNRHPGLRDSLAAAGVSIVEVGSSPQAADLQITTAAMGFAIAHRRRGRLAIASNDTGFAPVLAYAAASGCETVSIGTWHRHTRHSSRPLSWTRNPLAQAACVSVLWSRVEPAEEPNFSRSRPDRAWQRLAWAPAGGVALNCSGGSIGDGGSTTDGGSVPYSIWRRGAARSECPSPAGGSSGDGSGGAAADTAMAVVRRRTNMSSTEWP